MSVGDCTTAAELICRTLGSVFPPFLKFVNNRTTAARCKKTQTYIEQAREIIRPLWDKLTPEEKATFQYQLDLVTNMQESLIGKRQFPESCKKENITRSHELKKASIRLWDLALSTSNRVANRKMYGSKEVKELEKDTTAHLQLRDGIPHMTGGMESSNMLFLLRASLDPPGTPIPANPWGITGSTPVNVSGLSKAPKISPLEYEMLAQATATAMVSTRRVQQ